jgi:hypothetical protein
MPNVSNSARRIGTIERSTLEVAKEARYLI